jgi:hypothetical protein
MPEDCIIIQRLNVQIWMIMTPQPTRTWDAPRSPRVNKALSK